MGVLTVMYYRIQSSLLVISVFFILFKTIFDYSLYSQVSTTSIGALFLVVFLVQIRDLPTCGVPPRGTFKNPTVGWDFRENPSFAWYFLTQKSHKLHRDSWDF